MTDVPPIKTEDDPTEAETSPTYIQLNTIYPHDMAEDDQGQNYSGPVIIGTTSLTNQSKIYMYHTGLINPCIIQPLVGSKQVIVETGAIQVVCDPNTLYTIDQTNPDEPTICHSQPSTMPIMEFNSEDQNDEEEEDTMSVKPEEVSYIDEHQGNSEHVLNIINDHGERVRFFKMNEEIEFHEESNQESVESTIDSFTLDNLQMGLTPRYIGNNVDDPESEIELSSGSSHDVDDPPYRAQVSESESESDSDSDYKVAKYSLRKRKKQRVYELDSEDEVAITDYVCKCPDPLAINHKSEVNLRLQCSLCTTQFDCNFHFKAHNKTHSFPFECTVCFSRFPLAVNEDIHYRYKHCPKPRRFICRICLVDQKSEKTYNLHYPQCCKKNTIQINIIDNSMVIYGQDKVTGLDDSDAGAKKNKKKKI